MTPIHEKEFPRGIEVVTSAIIENSDGKILLVKSPKWHNKWTFPGGHVEPGEVLEDAALREAREEVFREVVKRPTPVQAIKGALAKISKVRVRRLSAEMSKIGNPGIRFEPGNILDL